MDVQRGKHEAAMAQLQATCDVVEAKLHACQQQLRDQDEALLGMQREFEAARDSHDQVWQHPAHSCSMARPCRSHPGARSS